MGLSHQDLSLQSRRASYSDAPIIALSKVSIMVKQTTHGRHDDEPDPGEFTNLLWKRCPSVSSRILASVLVASALAILFALFSSDDMRKFVADAKVSIAAMLPAPFTATQPAPVQLTAEEIVLLKDPARLSKPANQTSGAHSVTPDTIAPSREATKSALQSATQR